MRPLEGRVLQGLDEFMLRLGHLTVLCETAVEAGGSAFRFAREAATRLNQLVPVSENELPAVTKYLRQKKLCPGETERSSKDFDQDKFRYPDIVIVTRGDNQTLEPISHDGKPIEITWQDHCLASEHVPSKVGAITIHGKRGSKTGLSHVIDWAAMLELTSASGQLYAQGQLLAKFRPSNRKNNPYAVGHERLLFAEAILDSDFDVFAALCSSLAKTNSPIRKKEATKYYIDAVQEIVEAAETDRHLSHGRRHNLISLWRDLRHTTRDKVAVGSTAWHRAASRFETYVDLGLLEKGKGGEEERYEYTYYVTDRLRQADLTLRSSPDARHWIDEHLADVILGTSCVKEPMSADELIQLLPPLVRTLTRATSQLSIRALATGLVWLTAETNKPVSFGSARLGLQDLAISRPEIARLSTGSTTSPEYISLKLDLRS